MEAPDFFYQSPLFDAVQHNKVFPDGKTFVDCTPKSDLSDILKKYIEQKDEVGFDLKKFVLANFDLPYTPVVDYASNVAQDVASNIEALWPVLTRQPDVAAGSLMALPHPYIVPGGRFGEVYYWDSYFTMLGLKESGKTAMIENIINNFSYLIDLVGYIPNGNRTYFMGRSQPPFYAMMIQLLAEIKGDSILIKYISQLEKEYAFWMLDHPILNKNNTNTRRVMLLDGHEILNRYWDENDTPRPESYREDVELAHQSAQNQKVLFRHLRAGAESGWDYSCRWFQDENAFDTIHTTDIAPVDLNCLLYNLEKTIAKAHQLNGNTEGAAQFDKRAQERQSAILKYCWDAEQGFFVDYNAIANVGKKTLTLAGVFPLFFKIATDNQANYVAQIIEKQFLNAGGVVSTLKQTGQQWDAPNGWAPLQWTTIIGLENYGFHDLAQKIAQRWIQLNTDVFKRTGKLMEKYNVIDTHLEAGGGEYPGQDGFGWTNGVLLALIKKYA